MSPLADAVYEILRRRTSSSEPRITYAQLGRELREASKEFCDINHRSQRLYAALCEVGAECRRLNLPSLPELVVRADTKRPGDAYFGGRSSNIAYEREKLAAWRKEVEAVKCAKYPMR